MTTLVTVPFDNDQAAQARALLGAASAAGFDPTSVRTGRQGFRVPKEVFEEYTSIVGRDSEAEAEVDTDSEAEVDTDSEPEPEKPAAKKAPAKKAAAKKTTSKSSLDDVLS